ncbi:prepilin-type N-terminal cleavage/methylation domain-containing protein [Candidatus Sumerlaeota bacterium]
MSRGLTIVELLIVLLIIAILAIAALPNLMAFQVRAKVSKAQTDLRSIAAGLEAYYVENEDYPPNCSSPLVGIVPYNLTTPVAFLSTGSFVDPFADPLPAASSPIARFYTYNRIVTDAERQSLSRAGRPPPAEAVDYPPYNPGAFAKYGQWRLVSRGPDRAYHDELGFPAVLYGSDIRYDPTNGCFSFGNVLRTHKSPIGHIFD